MFLPWQEGWNEMNFKVPCQPEPMILWLHTSPNSSSPRSKAGQGEQLSSKTRQGTSKGPGTLLCTRDTLCGQPVPGSKQPLLPHWKMWLPRFPPLHLKTHLGPGQQTSFHPRPGRRGRLDLQPQERLATCPHQRQSPPTTLSTSCNPDQRMMKDWTMKPGQQQ